MSTTDEIKSRLDIVDLVSESVQLRRSGKNHTGFCPFHDNTRTPAFVVFQDSGTWRCFGQCNEGGDIFSFVMKKEGWDFSEALRQLAAKAGVQLRPPTPKEQEQAEEHDRLRILLEDASTFYRHNLTNTHTGKAALEYLYQRGLTEEIIEVFGLGFAPQSWDATTNYFKSKGYSEDELISAGLVGERESGGIYDRFRQRIIFPIRDERGRMAGFGARILDPEDIPKFLNSPQTPIFDKGKLLYGLYNSRKSIRSLDQVVIVEGYLDVIALHQHGYTNAVSPMGTALTEHQMRSLKRFTRNIVLAMDSDAAGVKATLRGLQVARKTMDREGDLFFDARGLLHHEARLKADIRVTTLPESMDPDDVVNADPEEWEQILGNAQPIVVHVMETLSAGRDLDDPKIKTEIASQVLPLIADLSNPIERDTYKQRLARLLRVDERTLSGRIRSRPQRHFTQQKLDNSTVEAPPKKIVPSSTLEAHCLGVILRRPSLIYRIDRELQEHGLSRLSYKDFQNSDYQVILDLIIDSLNQTQSEPLNFVLNSLPLPLMDVADGTLAQTKSLNPNEDAVLEDLLRGILNLRRSKLRQRNNHLRFLQEEAQQDGDLRATEHQETAVQNIMAMQRIDKALGNYTYEPRN